MRQIQVFFLCLFLGACASPKKGQNQNLLMKANPPKIQKVGSSSNQDPMVEFSWSPEVGVHYYELRINPKKTEGFTIHTVVDANQFEIPLKSGTYRWVVVAYDENGNAMARSTVQKFHVGGLPRLLANESRKKTLKEKRKKWFTATEPRSGQLFPTERKPSALIEFEWELSEENEQAQFDEDVVAYLVVKRVNFPELHEFPVRKKQTEFSSEFTPGKYIWYFTDKIENEEEWFDRQESGEQKDNQNYLSLPRYFLVQKPKKEMSQGD